MLKFLSGTTCTRDVTYVNDLFVKYNCIHYTIQSQEYIIHYHKNVIMLKLKYLLCYIILSLLFILPSWINIPGHARKEFHYFRWNQLQMYYFFDKKEKKMSWIKLIIVVNSNYFILFLYYININILNKKNYWVTKNQYMHIYYIHSKKLKSISTLKIAIFKKSIYILSTVHCLKISNESVRYKF